MMQPIIDAHQHFWHYHPSTHQWIDDSMCVIRQDFLPKDLQPIYQQNNVVGCVAVQAEQSIKETDFLLQLASQNSFIKAIVGWVNLQSENLEKTLDVWSGNDKLKGFRHILQAETPSFMLQPNFLRGISALQKRDFTYDILIYPTQLSAAIELIKLNPNSKFIVDHLAKPYIKHGLIDDWSKQIKEIAAYPNVYCKLSGLVTEANCKNWTQETFTPYIDVVVEAFGTKRLLFGSDWPVCLVAGNYKSILEIITNYFARFSVQEQADVLHNNALKFYNL